MASDQERKAVERINLQNVIHQWNANRLDLFELSEPNEDLEFHGVMRFYFQDADQKVVTKCIRVSSTATVRDVVLTLIEKFRPDIRMLSLPDYTGYALYEIHENGEERKLGPDEKPLLVQLNWHKDDREGRFLFRRMDDKSRLPVLKVESLRFGRKLSKREKKDKKKKKEILVEHDDRDGIAEKLYTELPETSFTRSISNPEAVMRRRRQQKLEKKLQQFRQENGAGSNEAGGTLRIFGESLNRDVPYKTLLLSTTDNASHVVKEILDKYGMDKEDPLHYCLVQVLLPPLGEPSPLDHMHEQRSSSPPGSIGSTPAGIKEYILDDDDCPLAIERQHSRIKGTLSFHIRRRPADYQPRKRKKRPSTARSSEQTGKGNAGLLLLPWLEELGSERSGEPFRHRLMLGMTEVGSAPSADQALQLQGPGIHPRHCVFAHTEGIVTVTPSHHEAEIYVDSARIFDTTILQHGSVVRFGRHQAFRFLIPHIDQPYVSSRDNYRPEYLERTCEDDTMMSGETYETTFDVLGNVEATSTNSHHSDEVVSSPSSRQKYSHISHHESSADHRRGNDPILPAVLEFWEEHEGAFLECVIGQLDWSAVQFKLAPAYTLYMACRYRASTHFRPEISPTERAHRLTALANEIGARVRSTVEAPNGQPGPLAFWLANASELLHFLRQDRHLSAYTLDAQDQLSEAVQRAFAFLVSVHRKELARVLPSAFAPHHQVPQEAAVGDILSVLGGTMSLLRRCRVNAALTIQLFSWLFHHINVVLFNGLVSGSPGNTNYCCRAYGAMLKRRLAHLVAWAEKQGLELAADCHLARIIQAAHLLQTSKSTAEDVTSISTACFKLNSVQLRTLLERYQTTPDEPPVSRSLVEGVVKVAENTADEQARSEGREVRLEEDADLQLPFLLPEDGYSCDIVRGVPAGLQEFLQPLALSGLCRLTLQPTSVGLWTIYMSDQDILRPAAGSCPEQHQPASSLHHPQMATSNPSKQLLSSSIMPSSSFGGHNGSAVRPPSQNMQVFTICLQKSNSGMGLSIVAARGVNQEKLGIYIKSVVKGGAADQDGRLQAGDQLLKVDGHSLIGITQEKAAELMTQTGQVVTLEVAKQGAIYHGLAGLLCQPSPVMHRGSRRMSERDIPSRIVHEEGYVNHSQGPPGYQGHPRIQGSKSVPALNSEFENEACDPLPLPLTTEHGPNAGHHSIHSFNTSFYQQNQQPLHHPPLQLQQNLGYSRASSTASIPADTSVDCVQYQDPQPSYSHPPKLRPRQDPVMIEQQMSHQAHVQEERHYQNISMYQQHRTGSPARCQTSPQPQNPPPYSVANRHVGPVASYSLPHQQLQQRYGLPLHSSQGSLGGESQHVPPGGPSRPLSTLVSQREQEQYVNAIAGLAHHRHLGPPSPQKSKQFQTDGSFFPHNRGPAGGREYPAQSGSQPQLENNAFCEDTNTDGVDDNYQRVPPHGSPSQRNVLRQEAKMEEMKEEVRRREEREQHAMVHAHNYGSKWGPQPNRSTCYGSPTRVQSNVAPHRPSHTSLDAQLGAGNERSQVNYRYRSSANSSSQQCMVEERQYLTPGIRGSGYKEQECNTTDLMQQVPPCRDSKMDAENVLSPSPWEREEKEMRRQQRLEEARQARDNEIYGLESLAERSLKQEERLRALRLDQEFERRAQEVVGAGEEDEEDEDLMERAEKRERILKLQEDLGNTRHHDWAQEPFTPPQAPKTQLEEQTVRLHKLKLEENTKKQELEAQRRAEECLIREAQRRQEEEQLRGATMEQRARVTFQDTEPPPPLPSSPPPSEAQQRLDDLLSNVGTPIQRTKKVSFHDIPQEVEVSYDANGNEEEGYTLQDIDEVLNTSHTSSYLIGSTPGVIGAQEVYRDPRQRIERQRMLEQPTRPPGPEKLTFREKMKMFAREMGENNTPKDKVKISRAQREIETNLNGVSVPNH